MAIVNLSGGANGSLYLPQYNLGADADTVTVLAEATAYNYNIYTYGQNDLLDLRSAHSDNTHYAYVGAGKDTVQGGNGLEIVADQSGNDLYLLRGGQDFVYMGKGNDTVNAGDGLDTVYFSYIYGDFSGYRDYSGGVTCDLQKTSVQDFGIFGRDRLIGFENIFGSYGNDRIWGTSGDNTIQTATGNDKLFGRGGRDLLVAEGGGDVLNGGMGWDTMLLGDDDHRDVVKYSSIRESNANPTLNLGNLDNVIQFQASGAGFDKFDFKVIDARAGTKANEAFVFRGTGEFRSKGGEIRLVEDAGNTILYLDNDADAAAEMVIFVTGTVGLTVDNFIL